MKEQSYYASSPSERAKSFVARDGLVGRSTERADCGWVSPRLAVGDCKGSVLCAQCVPYGIVEQTLA